MKFIELKEKLKEHICFSVNDILKIDPEFHSQRLSEWQKKDYIIRISKDCYIFSGLEINEQELFAIANKLYSPSYISLEMAFSYYGLIPEGVYSITSVSSRITSNFDTQIGHFAYRHIKPSLFFGYRVVSFEGHSFDMAEAEKAMLDYFYLNPDVNNEASFAELRINADSFFEKVDINKLNKYLEQFDNNSLERRVELFINYLKND
jgi:predicted transcriptional regulator of viral defense system